MAKGKIPTVRQSITLAVMTVEYLERLAIKGTHGSDISGVARTLVEQGIRRAISEGFIAITNDQPRDGEPIEL